MLGTLREVGDAPRKRNNDITYFVAKELLMTERTYKRDLELVTVVSVVICWSFTIRLVVFFIYFTLILFIHVWTVKS